jgi:O-succinylbenzoic acid--CoA ligase
MPPTVDRHPPPVTSTPVRRLIVVEARGTGEFVDRLRHAWGAGDAVLPLDPRLPPPARQRVLAAARPEEPVADGDALVVATSGTSGDPKAVVLTHDAVDASARATSRRLGVDPASDRWLACLPLAHVGGLAVVTRAILTGTPLTVHDGFDAGRVEAATRGPGQCTLASLVPTMLRRMDPTGFRIVVLGGSAMPPDLPANAIATYGMTETGSGVVYDGVPLDGVDVRVVGGQVELRCPMLLRCYRDGTDPRDAEGWFPTGDAGAWDETEGRPDPEWGQRVTALVVPVDRAHPPTLDELRRVAKRDLPTYCAPRELVLVTELPRTRLGKLVRREL